MNQNRMMCPGRSDGALMSDFYDLRVIGKKTTLSFGVYGTISRQRIPRHPSQRGILSHFQKQARLGKPPLTSQYEAAAGSRRPAETRPDPV